MENKTINVKDIQKTGEAQAAPVIKEVKETSEVLTPQQEFLQECNEQEAGIFNQLIDILTDQCQKEDWEAIKSTDESFEEFAKIITYVKNGKIKLEENGVILKLRKPLVDESKVMAEHILFKYKKDEQKEAMFMKNVKIKRHSYESQTEQTIAALAASCVNEVGNLVSMKSLRVLRRDADRDYAKLIDLFNFFRG